MTLVTIVIFSGIAMMAYAMYYVFTPSQPRKKKQPPHQPAVDFAQDDSQRLKEEIQALRGELQRQQADYSALQTELDTNKKTAEEFQSELDRRNEWVGKSDEVVDKIKSENLELKSKFMAKEKELQEGFAKKIDLERKARDLEMKVSALEQEGKEKTSQIEAQRHQLDRAYKEIKLQQELVSGYQKKKRSASGSLRRNLLN